MYNIKTLGKDTLIYGFGTVLKKFIGFVLLPFYTRALSPVEYGILDTLATFTYLISIIIALGLDGATGRYFFIANSEKEKGRVLYTSAVIRLITNFLPIIIILPFSHKISSLLFDTAEYSWVVAISLLTIPTINTSKLQDLLFRYYREVWKYTFVLSIQSIINPITGILLVVVFQLGVLGATLSSFITSLFIIIFAYFFYAKKKYIRQFSWVWAKKMLKFGYPLIFTGILVWVNDISDRFFLLHYKDLKQIGLYSIGSTFSQPIILVNLALSMSSVVLIMSLYSEEKEEDKPKTKAFLTKIWYTYLAVAISVASFISIFSYDIVKFVTTKEYIGSVLVIPFLLFSQILFQSAQITGNGMTLKEQSKPYFWIMLASAGVNVALNFYFIPLFGYVGAAITTLFSNVIYFVFAYYWSQKVFYIKRSFLMPAIYFILSLSIAIFFPFYALKGNIHLSYYFKICALITVLIIPFILKIIDYRLVLSIVTLIRQKTRI